jgi:hypothetical protein
VAGRIRRRTAHRSVRRHRDGRRNRRLRMISYIPCTWYIADTDSLIPVPDPAFKAEYQSETGFRVLKKFSGENFFKIFFDQK